MIFYRENKKALPFLEGLFLIDDVTIFHDEFSIGHVGQLFVMGDNYKCLVEFIA